MIVVSENASTDFKATDYVHYTCDTCGYNGLIRYDHYRNGIGCSVCAGKKVLVGYNDIRTLRPDIAKFLTIEADATTHTPYSSKFARFTCPHCGYVTSKCIRDVTRRGFVCNICNVAISYPNRVMGALLSVLGIEFDTERVFSWSQKKRYDFYIAPSTIIEMNGAQHYWKSFKTSTADISANDRTKKGLALNNGIKTYIEIDASISDIGYIAHRIVNSELKNIFELGNIDWSVIDTKANASIFSASVDMYNKGASISEIANLCHISTNTIRRLLKTANTQGKCHYSPMDSILESQKLAAEGRKKRVICTTTAERFDSIKDAGKSYGIRPDTITECLKGRIKRTRAHCDAVDGFTQWAYEEVI